MLYNNIEELIGNTPLLKIDSRVHGLKNIELYAKLEYMNPFGSVKDRIAKGMLEPFWEKLENEKRTVIESSSGNTGKALAALCSVHGLNFKTITNRIKVPEQRMIMQVLGADIEELPGFSECPDPSDPNNAIALSTKLVNSNPDKYFYPDQYTSELNVKAHRNTGEEINKDLEKIDYYIGFLGTTGSTLGAGQVIKEKNPDAKIVGIIAESYNHIPGGREAQEMWEVGLFNKSFYSEILKGTIQQAIDGMLVLVRKCGLLCGPTSGVNFEVGLKYLKEQDKLLEGAEEKKKAVFIACDRIEPYMSYLEKYRFDLFTGNEKDRKHNFASQEEIDNAPWISCEDLNRQAKEMTSRIDILGNQAYSIGHIPGNVNIPDEILISLFDQGAIFPGDKKVVIVCRAGESSKKHVVLLRKQGYDAYSLKGGVTEWKNLGFVLDQTTDAECYIGKEVE